MSLPNLGEEMQLRSAKDSFGGQGYGDDVCVHYSK